MTPASMVTMADAGEFTSKERDAETGLDWFGFRYLSSAQGRFTSVDPAMASAVLDDPQTWNRYSYVNNSTGPGNSASTWFGAFFTNIFAPLRDTKPVVKSKTCFNNENGGQVCQ